MKKIFLLFTITALIKGAAAQNFFQQRNATHPSHNSQRGINPSNNIQSPPFFSEDFSAGIPGSWTNTDNTGNGVLWRVTTTGAFNQLTPVDETLNPAGTSAANGYLILDSDSAGAFNENTDLTTVAINCSGHSIVHLSFNEYFAQYLSSTGTVSVSKDNITWINYFSAETGLIQDSGTANPTHVDLDISATAANQAVIYVRFNFTGMNDYWWFVDDIVMYEPSADDLATLFVAPLSPGYTAIPVSQSNALVISGDIKNTGMNPANGGTALLELVDSASNTATFSETVNLNSLSAGADQVVSPTNSFMAPAPGTYFSRITAILAGDSDPANDQLTSPPFHITDSVYQRDDGILENAQPIGAGSGQHAMAGQNFKINSAGDLTSVTFFLKDTFSFNANGTPLYFTVHPQLNDSTPPDASTILATTETLTLYPGTIPAGGAFYTLEILTGSLHVTPGLYFIGFHEEADLIPMGYSLNVFTPNAVWVHADALPAGWARAIDLGVQISYMIRANFGPVPDAVNQISENAGLIVYPNPSEDGLFKVNIGGLTGTSIPVQVKNIVGQLVYTGLLSVTQPFIDLSFVAPGVYMLSVGNGSALYTQKIIKSGGR